MMHSIENILNDLGLEIVEKPNYQRLSHKIVAYLVNFFFTIVGIFSNFDKDFHTDFNTQMGKYIYVTPDFDIDDPYDRSEFRHELAHAWDAREHGFMYKISYVLSRHWRFYWEARAYCMQMLVFYNQMNKIPNHWPRHFAKLLSSPSYAWCADFEEAYDLFKEFKQKVESNTFDRDSVDPNVDYKLQNFINLRLKG